MNDSRLGRPSASGGSKWYACAGSPALEAQAPEEEPTDEAIQGTEIAKARELETEDGLDEEGKTIAQRLGEQEKRAVSDWMAERFPGEEALPVPIREQRCWIRDSQTLEPVASAKPDWFYLFREEALIGDDKSGYLQVTDAHKNIQARIQAVALKHEYPHLKRIRVAISQFRFRGRVTGCDYDEKGLAIADKEIFFRLWLTQDPQAPRVPGSHCRWCKARGGLCVEAAAFSLLPIAVTPKQFDLATKESVTLAVANMTLEQRAYIRHNTSLIESILKATRNSLVVETDEALAGVGLKKVPSAGVRTLPDVQVLWAILHKEGVSEEELRSILKASFGAAQELLKERIKKANPEITDKAATEQADKILEPAVTMAPREPQLRSL